MPAIDDNIAIFMVFFGMLFMHIKSDFNQGIIAFMKQSKWWEDNYPQDMYKNDYRIVLVIHSIEWTISILIFPAIYYLIAGGDSLLAIIIAFTLNTIIHARVDDLKANKLAINLIVDQVIHFIQITITWFILVVIL